MIVRHRCFETGAKSVEVLPNAGTDLFDVGGFGLQLRPADFRAQQQAVDPQLVFEGINIKVSERPPKRLVVVDDVRQLMRCSILEQCQETNDRTEQQQQNAS